MRPPFLALAALLAVAACTPETDVRPPPLGRFYFPTGVHHVPEVGAQGTLFVASANFDRRFDAGMLHAIDLDAIGLPALGPVPPAVPLELPELGLTAENQVTIQAFAGELASYDLGAGVRRVFVPTRSEDSDLHWIDANGTSLDCGSGTRDCTASGASLEALAVDGLPRAVQPIGVAVDQDRGRVYVTHLDYTDSPVGSNLKATSYLVNLDARNPTPTTESYLPIPAGGVHSVAIGEEWLFLSGREFAVNELLQAFDPETRSRIPVEAIRTTTDVGSGRGIAINEAENRIYVATRDPDQLLIVEVVGATTRAPSFTPVRAVPLPSGPSALRIIERPGRGELVAVSCTDADALVLYSAEAGAVVNQLEQVGDDPYGLAVATDGASARIFVTTFTDGQVAVVDIPDLAVPTGARVVARLGRPQHCLVRPNDPGCAEEAQ